MVREGRIKADQIGKRITLSGPDTPEIYFLILIFTTLVLISCVQAKNSLMQRKGLFLGKKNKIKRPGGCANGRRPQAGKKNIKNLIHSIDKFLGPVQEKRISEDSKIQRSFYSVLKERKR
jgi:hypothetical protein